MLERLENDIFLLHKKQTNNDANEINGFAHRYVSTGNTNTTMALADIVKARTAHSKANVSKIGRKAIVDATVAAQMLLIDGFTRQDIYGPNENIKTGMGSTKWIGQYMGYDFYESNMLDEETALDYVTGGTKVANMFLGEEALIGAMRLPIDMRFWRDDNYLRDVYHATTRYGLDLYRDESLVVVLTEAGHDHILIRLDRVCQWDQPIRNVIFQEAFCLSKRTIVRIQNKTKPGPCGFRFRSCFHRGF